MVMPLTCLVMAGLIAVIMSFYGAVAKQSEDHIKQASEWDVTGQIEVIRRNDNRYQTCHYKACQRHYQDVYKRQMLQAMNTGHAGSMSTGHGNSIIGMLKRLETMYLMATPLSIDAIRSQIAQAIEIMIDVYKRQHGSYKIRLSRPLRLRNWMTYMNCLLKMKNILRIRPRAGYPLSEK